MNRRDKNALTRGKILKSAEAEFALHGYEAGSLNAVCQGGGVSKGIIYHYFGSKEGLYLACVEDCFDSLTACLSEKLVSLSPETGLRQYFDARTEFFRAHGEFARIFCGAVVSPPPELKAAIGEKRRAFDEFNAAVLKEIIKGRPLRGDLSEEEILRVLQQFQDFLNASYQRLSGSPFDLEHHEKDCRSALSIFLYGIISRE